MLGCICASIASARSRTSFPFALILNTLTANSFSAREVEGTCMLAVPQCHSHPALDIVQRHVHRFILNNINNGFNQLSHWGTLKLKQAKIKSDKRFASSDALDADNVELCLWWTKAFSKFHASKIEMHSNVGKFNSYTLLSELNRHIPTYGLNEVHLKFATDSRHPGSKSYIQL